MSSWKDTILAIAPTIATALGSPLAGAAVSAIGKILGIDNATTELVADVINSGKLTPEQISEIKKLELQYQNDEKERGFKYAELQFKDIQGARDMQVATNSNVPPLLALLVTVGFFGILIFMVTAGSYKPTEPLLVMLGSLGTAWTMIIGFYFGSSHGSQAKDHIIANSTPNP